MLLAFFSNKAPRVLATSLDEVESFVLQSKCIALVLFVPFIDFIFCQTFEESV
jgi:hypothetical protein